MNGRARRAISTPGEYRDPSRSAVSPFVSVALHIVVIALLARVVMVRSDWIVLFGARAEPIVVERVGFLSLPSVGTSPAETPRPGGDNRAVVRSPAPPALVAPTGVPSFVPPAPPASAPRQDEGGSGPLVGTGGAARGIRPSYSDPRVWVSASPIVTAPMSPQQRLDSVVGSSVARLNDSLAALPAGREAGDWTITRGGRKYGIDQKFIRLGPFSIPTALLAALPLNATANPTAEERYRRLSSMRFEIQEQAARAARDDEFRAAVRSLRERRERERREKQKAAEPAAAEKQP